MGTDPRVLAIIDRVRSDVAARERAGARGLLEMKGVLAVQ
jgi:hypothetical protein